MEQIALFFGGKSVEHEVSVITALQVMNNIDKQKYALLPIFIDKQGQWWLAKHANQKQTYAHFNKAKKWRVIPLMGQSKIVIKNMLNKKVVLDACINCCHGTGGEDGALQGALEGLNVPYSGPAVLPSALCMNKIVSKQLFEYHNLPIVPYQTLKRGKNPDVAAVCQTIGFPAIVKPCSLGSSVGISRCETVDEVSKAIEVAFEFDDQVIVEKAVQNLKEINCSVQRIGGQVVCGELEMPISWEKFLTYEQKYVSKNKGDKKRIVGVRLGKKIQKQIEDYSVFVYEKFGLDGVIRIDYLMDDVSKQIYINEVNTIPGSLAFYLWKGKGISLTRHIDLQIEQAKQKWAEKQKNKTNFTSNILQ